VQPGQPGELDGAAHGGGDLAAGPEIARAEGDRVTRAGDALPGESQLRGAGRCDGRGGRVAGQGGGAGGLPGGAADLQPGLDQAAGGHHEQQHEDQQRCQQHEFGGSRPAVPPQAPRP
jgi:hypothetical protein